jgi:hypothetical protein
MPRRFSGAKNGFRNLPRSRAETGDDVKARDYLVNDDLFPTVTTI